jgi:uncharacterized alkaline shock family protein YloU
VNTFNKIVAILLWLILLAVSIVFALMPDVVAQWLKSFGDNLLLLVQSWKDYNSLYFLAFQVAFLVVSVLLFGALLLAEVWPKKQRGVLVKTEKGTHARMEEDSVTKRIAWNLDQLPGVISVQPRVTPRGKKVDVSVDVETSPDVDIPSKTEEISRTIREVVEERMGLVLGKVHVMIKYSRFPEGFETPSAVAATKPAAQTPTPSAIVGGGSGEEGTESE